MGSGPHDTIAKRPGAGLYFLGPMIPTAAAWPTAGRTAKDGKSTFHPGAGLPTARATALIRGWCIPIGPAEKSPDSSYRWVFHNSAAFGKPMHDAGEVR